MSTNTPQTTFHADSGHFIADLLFEGGNVATSALPFGVTALEIVIESAADTHRYPWPNPPVRESDCGNGEWVVTLTAVLVESWNVTGDLEHELCAVWAGALSASTNENTGE
jgi:hypothetical protein